MTQRSKKPFFELEENLDDAAERVAAAKSIPTLMPPGEAPVARVREVAAPLPLVKPVAPSPSLSEKAELEFFRVRCPAYLTAQLEAKRTEFRAQGRKVTLSYLIMKALRHDGYHIKDEDFVEDGRRIR